MYTLQFFGFLGFKEVTFHKIEDARKAFAQIKNETYRAYSDGIMKDFHWNSWELLQDGKTINSGNFN